MEGVGDVCAEEENLMALRGVLVEGEDVLDEVEEPRENDAFPLANQGVDPGPT